jgi:membrane-associated phospholipid phosphatase
MASTGVERLHPVTASTTRGPRSEGPTRRYVLPAVVGWLALAVVTQLAGLAAAGELLPGEAAAARAIHGFDALPLDYLMAGFSTVGGGTGLLVLLAGVVAFLLARRRYGAAAFAVAGVLGAGIITRVLKDGVGRPRPGLTEPHDRGFLAASLREVALVVAVLVAIALVTRHRKRALLFAGVFAGILGVSVGLDALAAVESGRDSFPSGHSTGAAALAAVVVALTWNTRYRVHALVTGLLFACAVAVSRMHFGVHYPSDVLGGLAVAVAWVCLLVLLASLVRLLVADGHRKRRLGA